MTPPQDPLRAAQLIAFEHAAKGDHKAAWSTLRRAIDILAALPRQDEPGIDVERLRWAEWISEVGDSWPTVAQGDWACAECRPTSDILVPGFRCVVHAARASLVRP